MGFGSGVFEAEKVTLVIPKFFQLRFGQNILTHFAIRIRKI